VRGQKPDTSGGMVASNRKLVTKQQRADTNTWNFWWVNTSVGQGSGFLEDLKNRDQTRKISHFSKNRGQTREIRIFQQITVFGKIQKSPGEAPTHPPLGEAV